MGFAAGIDVWVTTRNDDGANLAESLGVKRIFRPDEDLPRRVDAVVDNVGAASITHSLRSVRRGGVVVINGVTTGHLAEIDLMRIFVEQIDVRGTIMVTLDKMKAMMDYILTNEIKSVIGQMVPMTDARDAFAQMIDGRTHGKTVLTR
jgi:D-arabinose 1-dehydrogenase-like Zn-dependent alcohol dehydrogenase